LKAILTKPVVGVQLDTRIAETIPAGAAVEISEVSPRGWVEISWNGLWFSVFQHELLEACSGDDAARIRSERDTP
jgi:hypothetical protein